MYALSHGPHAAVLERPTAAPALREPAPARAAAGEPLILVVDANTRLLEQMGRALTAACWRCALAQDTRRAWRWVGHERLSLIIIDWGLPGNGATRLISAIRSARDAAVPILALAPLAHAEAVQRAEVDAYLRRPYFARDLVDLARALLRD